MAISRDLNRCRSACLLFLALGCGNGETKSASPAAAGSAGAGVGGAANEGGSAGSGTNGGTGSDSAGSGGESLVAGAGGTGASGGTASTPAGAAGASSGGETGGSGGARPGTEEVLRIYWVDTEGGAATVLAAPDGRIIVVDAGFNARDAERVASLLKSELNATKIDVMIVTHYHLDHVGGVPALAKLLPIAEYVDHGEPVETGRHIDDYLDLISTDDVVRTVVDPGQKRAFGSLELTFVTAAGEVAEPLPTAIPNDGCENAMSKSQIAGAENPESVGFVARFGSFDFLDLGDFTWNVEQKLVCPTNRVGVVDLYQVSHHGMDISSSPQLVNSVKPLVAVMNNGATKGGSPATFELLRSLPALEGLWSLHRVTANDAVHNAEEDLTANLAGADQAFWLSATVEASGKFTLTNARNQVSRSYQAR